MVFYLMKSKRFYPLILLFLFVWIGPVFAEETLTWENCLSEAKKNHPDLISAIENVNQQKANTSIVASALFPQINSSVDVSRAQNNMNNSISGTSKSKILNSFSYGATGTQIIFDGFKTINQMNAASETAKAAEEGYQFSSAQVRLNLRTAFVNLLKAQEFIHVTEEIIKIRKSNLDLISLRYQSGLEHKGALLTAEANLAQANFGFAQTKRNVEFSQRQMTKEMGRMEFKPVMVKGEFVVKDPAKEKPDLDALAKSHPNLLQAIAKKNAAEFNVKSAYANFVPKLSGTAGADKFSNQWPPRGDEWDLGLSVTMPLFEGGLRIAQIAQATAAFRQAVADERSLRDSIVVNLERTWAFLQDAVETVDVQKKVLTATEERSKIAGAQFSTGFITFDSWIIIENDLVSAKMTYLEAQANALIAEANWIQAKGDTLEYAK